MDEPWTSEGGKHFWLDCSSSIATHLCGSTLDPGDTSFAWATIQGCLHFERDDQEEKVPGCLLAQIENGLESRPMTRRRKAFIILFHEFEADIINPTFSLIRRTERRRSRGWTKRWRRDDWREKGPGSERCGLRPHPCAAIELGQSDNGDGVKQKHDDVWSQSQLLKPTIVVRCFMSELRASIKCVWFTCTTLASLISPKLQTYHIQNTRRPYSLANSSNPLRPRSVLWRASISTPWEVHLLLTAVSTIQLNFLVQWAFSKQQIWLNASCRSPVRTLYSISANAKCDRLGPIAFLKPYYVHNMLLVWRAIPSSIRNGSLLVCEFLEDGYAAASHHLQLLPRRPHQAMWWNQSRGGWMCLKTSDTTGVKDQEPR